MTAAFVDRLNPQPTQGRQQRSQAIGPHQRRQPHSHRDGAHRGGTSPHGRRLNVQARRDTTAPPQHPHLRPVRQPRQHRGEVCLNLQSHNHRRHPHETPHCRPLRQHSYTAGAHQRRGSRGGGGVLRRRDRRLSTPSTAYRRLHGGGMGAQGRCEVPARRYERPRRRTGAMGLVATRRRDAVVRRCRARRPKAGTESAVNPGSFPSDRDPHHTQIQGYSGCAVPPEGSASYEALRGVPA